LKTRDFASDAEVEALVAALLDEIVSPQFVFIELAEKTAVPRQDCNHSAGIGHTSISEEFCDVPAKLRTWVHRQHYV
jgi:hypothetical protein